MRVRISAGAASLAGPAAASVRRMGGIVLADSVEGDAAPGARLDAMIWITPPLPSAAHDAFTPAALNSALETGLVAAANDLRHAFAALASGGRAVLIGPMAPSTRPGSIAAAMVEAALISLTRSLAAELRDRDLAINMLLPREDGRDTALDAMLRFLLTGPQGATGLALPVSVGQDTSDNDIASTAPEDSR